MRPKLLTLELLDRLVSEVELGVPLERAALAVGVSPRSVRRWRREGQRELDELSSEARLALEIARARATQYDWRESARALEQFDPVRWGAPATLDEMLAELFDDGYGRSS